MRLTSPMVQDETINHPYSADFHTVDFICSWIDLKLLHTRKGRYSTMRCMDEQTIFTELHKQYIDVCVCTACTCFSIICPVLVEQINKLLMYYMKSTISTSVSGQQHCVGHYLDQLLVSSFIPITDMHDPRAQGQWPCFLSMSSIVLPAFLRCLRLHPLYLLCSSILSHSSCLHLSIHSVFLVFRQLFLSNLSCSFPSIPCDTQLSAMCMHVWPVIACFQHDHIQTYDD